MSAGLRASVGVAASCLFILIALSDLEGSAFSFTSSTHSMVFFLLITSSGLEGSTFSFTSFADSWRFGLKGTERVLTSYASLIHIYMLSFTSSRARTSANLTIWFGPVRASLSKFGRVHTQTNYETGTL